MFHSPSKDTRSHETNDPVCNTKDTMKDELSLPDRTTRSEHSNAGRAAIDTCVSGSDTLAGTVDTNGR